MAEDEQPVNDRLKRWSRIGLAIVSVLLLFLILSWHILRSDHKFVIRKVQETALEFFDLKLQLEGYRLEWTSPYPLIHFQLRGLTIASNTHPDKPVFQVSNASSLFNPWDLITGDFQAHPFQVDSAWIHLYTDSMEVETQLANGESGKTSTDGIDLDFSKLPAISFNYLDFHREDDYRHKWQWAKFSHLKIEARYNEMNNWSLYVRSDCFFEGLVFKEVDGGFLMKTPTELDLRISISNGGKTLHWDQSTLKVDRNEFALEGQYEWANPNHINLQISTDNITLAEARPLLSDKIKRTISNIQVDQPIRTEFNLSNQIIPNRKEAIRIEFITNNAQVKYKAVEMSSATLNGTFSNDCDEDGIGDPLTSCITFHQLDGDFFDVLPANLQGVIHNMEDPHVKANGRMDVALPRLNQLLTEKGKATFAKGHAIVNFQYDGPLENVVNAPFDDRDNRVKGDALFDQITLYTADRNITSPSLSGYLTFDESQTLLEDIDLDWMGAKIQLKGRMRDLPEFFFYDDQTVVSDLMLHFDQLDLDQFRAKSNGKPLDGSRLEEITQQLANNVNGQFRLRIDKLMYDTIFLTDFTTQLRLFSPRRAEFTDSSMVLLDSLSAKFMGKSPVYANLSVSQGPMPELAFNLHSPSAVQPANAFLPPEVNINRGKAEVFLAAHLPLHSILDADLMRSDIRFDGLVKLTEVEIMHKALPAPVENITGPIKFENEKLAFHDLQFQYKNAPLSLYGQIDDFTPFSPKKAKADLRLNGKLLDLRSSTTQARSQKDEQQVISPPELFRSLAKVFKHATGDLDIVLDEVVTNSQTITPLLLKARLIPDDEIPDQHQISIDSFNLGFGDNNYFKGKAQVRDPKNPNIVAQIDGQLELKQLGQLLPSEYIEMRSGDFAMDLSYQSPLYDTLSAINYLLNAKIDGNAELKKGKLIYNFRDFKFENISGRFKFDEKDLYIKSLDLKVNGNRMVANGQSNDFFSFFVLPDRRANIELEVASPRFDFGGFTAPQGLQQDTLRILRKGGKLLSPHLSGVTSSDTTSTFQETAGYIDQLLDQGSIEMSTDFKEVVYQDFNAQRVDGHISLAPDTVQLHNLKMKVADGTFSIAGLISNIVRHSPKMEVSIEMDKNNVREIFRQFDDFGQGDLSFSNVEGLISAGLHFKADVNASYNILPETMHGDMNVKLAGGELIDLKVFDKLSGFLFRNRGLDHVILDTLELHSHIRGSDLYLDDFYLHSSSFDFGALGRYSFGPDNNTRVLFSIPIRNLFKRHISLEEMRKGDSERKGINILIEARYKKGRMRFIWKPFVFNKKKYRLME